MNWNDLPHEELRSLLIARREEKKVRASRIAEILVLSRSAVSQIESGKMPIPRRNFREVLKAYGVTEGEAQNISPEFLKQADEAPFSLFSNSNLRYMVSKEDLDFLLQIYEGLRRPLTLRTVVELLRCRQKANNEDCEDSKELEE